MSPQILCFLLEILLCGPVLRGQIGEISICWNFMTVVLLTNVQIRRRRRAGGSRNLRINVFNLVYNLGRVHVLLFAIKFSESDFWCRVQGDRPTFDRQVRYETNNKKALCVHVCT